MQQVLAMHRFALGCALASASLCAGCCGSVDATTWQGTMNYAFSGTPAGAGADGGSDAGASPPSVIGATNLTVNLDAFAPWVQNGFSGGYCGSNTFAVILGPSCELTANVVSADFARGSSGEGSATIESGQTCTLDTPSGSFTVGVGGGSVAISGSVLDVLLDAPGANVEFQGNLQ
jgi:hypothetical protein